MDFSLLGGLFWSPKGITVRAGKHEIRERPGELRELPGEPREPAGEPREHPGELRELPGELRELPGELRGLPGELRELPGELREPAGELPRACRRAPESLPAAFGWGWKDFLKEMGGWRAKTTAVACSPGAWKSSSLTSAPFPFCAVFRPVPFLRSFHRAKGPGTTRATQRVETTAIGVQWERTRGRQDPGEGILKT